MWTDGRVKNSGRYLRMPPIACATPSDGPMLQGTRPWSVKIIGQKTVGILLSDNQPAEDVVCPHVIADY